VNNKPTKEHCTAMSSGRLYGLLFLCTLLSILTAGIWPLDFFPRNNAVVLPELKGLRFNGPHSAQKTATGGVAFTPQPLVWPPSAAEEGRDLTIEIAVKPDAEPGGSRYVMLGLFDQKSRAQVYLSQWQSFLLVRTLQEDPDIYREIDARGALQAGVERFITVSSSAAGTVIYLDGKPAQNYPGLQILPDAAMRSDLRLFLGNSPDGGNPWSGEIRRAAIYGRALSAQEAAEGYASWSRGAPACGGAVACYRFDKPGGAWFENATGPDNPLFIPERPAFARNFLTPIQMDAHDYQDILVNVLGFMPMGFLWFRWVERTFGWGRDKALWTAAACGLLISLAIETTQGFIPSRDSSQRDVVCNTLGALLGAWAALGAFRREAGQP
jgi:hypothetical protein